MLSPELQELLLKMLFATIAGGIVGLEREFRNKDAGLKTFVLICSGAAIFSHLGMLLGSTDPARIAAQIVTGVGFLGAGAIFKGKDRISGLTTAAFIWVVSAIGALIGIGLVEEGLLLAVGMVISVSVTGFIESLIRKVRT